MRKMILFIVLSVSIGLFKTIHAEVVETNSSVHINLAADTKFRFTNSSNDAQFENLDAACALGVREYTINQSRIVYSNPRADDTSCPGFGECDCIYEVTYYSVSTGNITDYIPDWRGQNWALKYPTCPDGYSYNSNIDQCQKGFAKGYYLKATSHNNRCESPKDGNPCNAATGNKYQVETDYVSPIPGDIRLTRYYNSQGSAVSAEHVAMNWRHTYSRTVGETPVERRAESQLIHMSLGIGDTNSSGLYSTAASACTSGWNAIKSNVMGGALSSGTATLQGTDRCNISQNGQVQLSLTVHSNAPIGLALGDNTPYIDTLAQNNLMTVTRPNGSQLVFEKIGSAWTALIENSGQLETLAYGWRYTDLHDTVEEYDGDGKLLTITTRDGHTQTLEYTLSSANGGDDNPSTLDRVSSDYGRALLFSYNDEGYLASVTTPDGLILYAHDNAGNFATVTYPDNTSRHYVYDEANYSHHLTGIIDEKGERFATWDYDTEGRAILSKHALDTQATTFTYNNDGTTTVTDPLGGSHTYTFAVKRGAAVVTDVSGDPCLTCANSQVTDRQYDSAGYLDTTTDWEGNVTDYTYNARGLQDERVEALGTDQQRTIKTQWHADYRLPTQVEVYDKDNNLIKRTTTTYDNQGRVDTTTEYSF